MEMTVAYDLKVLTAELKAQGLDLAEDGAKKVIKTTFAWLTKSAVLSENPYDDMAAVMYPMLEKQTLVQADKIDGKVG